MFKEYDIVRIKNEFENIPKGSKGTVLICYEVSNEYEVEFVDNDLNTIGVITISGKNLEGVN